MYKNKFSKKIVLAIILGTVVGISLFVSVRLLFNNAEATHYHANFAVFIDGKREEFKSPNFYEEVQACSATMTPRGRVHMHQPDNNVIHVHDKNVTWGHFFESFGWALGPGALVTDDVTYTSSNGKVLKFLLNDQEVNSPFDQIVGNEDTLLISYDLPTADFKNQFAAAKKPTPASQANTQQDPAACRGNTKPKFSERLKNAIW